MQARGPTRLIPECRRNNLPMRATGSTTPPLVPSLTDVFLPVDGRSLVGFGCSFWYLLNLKKKIVSVFSRIHHFIRLRERRPNSLH